MAEKLILAFFGQFPSMIGDKWWKNFKFLA